MPLAFPEVMQVDPLLHIVELGCGCGASIVPILKVCCLWLYGLICQHLCIAPVSKDSTGACFRKNHDDRDIGRPFWCLGELCFCTIRHLEVYVGAHVPGLKPLKRFTQANPSCTATVCDVSETAINSLCDIVESAGITPERVHAFAHDATAPTVQLEGSQADACLLVFTLSAVQPDDMAAMLALAHGVLKPGGRLLIRDYGLYDMPSLRFPAEQKLGENLYRRCADPPVHARTVLLRRSAMPGWVSCIAP